VFDAVNFGPSLLRLGAVDGSGATDLAIADLNGSALFATNSSSVFFLATDSNFVRQGFYACLGSGQPAATLGPWATHFKQLPSGRVAFESGADPWSPPDDLKLASCGDAGPSLEHLAGIAPNSPLTTQVSEIGAALLYYDETMMLQARLPAGTAPLARLGSVVDVSPDGARLLIQRATSVTANPDGSPAWQAPLTTLSVGLDGSASVDLLRAPTGSKWLPTPLGPAALSLRGAPTAPPARIGKGAPVPLGPSLPAAPFPFQLGLYVAVDPKPAAGAQ
jgi:hypothetical protein